MRLCWWAMVKELCGSSWSQDTTNFLRLTTRKTSELPAEPTSRKLPKAAFSKLDCVKYDCVKDRDGGAASRSGLLLKGSPSARSMSCPSVRSLPLCQGSLCANERARVMCSKGTSSAWSMSMCEKNSPSARGLTESKLQRIEETVSVKVSREGARPDVVSLLPSLGPAGQRNMGAAGLPDRRSLLCQSGVVPRPVVSTRWRWCRAFAARARREMLMQVFRAPEKHRAPV